MLIIAAPSIALYVLQAIGLYSIAKRCGLSCPWLAWIPVGNNWTLGAISDHYQEKTHGKTKSKRLLLTALAVIILCLSASVIIDFFTMAAEQSAPTSEVMGLFAVLVIISILMIIYDVLLYIALYQVFKSCDPSTALVFLLLSIFIGGLSSVLLFVQRNKSAGLADTYIDFC